MDGISTFAVVDEPINAPPARRATVLDNVEGTHPLGVAFFAIACVVGASYVGLRLLADLRQAPTPGGLAYGLLAIALVVALAFEFVNGFHDTANAVATVIYTHSLSPHLAVAWSGLWNFIGVVFSTGVVAFGIISLLPVELSLKVGSSAGFAMVFALLSAAIIWNLGTWYFGLPSSSSHTLVGSVIGVGIANQLMATTTGTSGVDWTQAASVGQSLLLSPLVGFSVGGLLLLITRKLVPSRHLYVAPEGSAPPPLWIRALLILTCTGVSFAHGSNDGQKGMGLIMLILIGTVPTAYALNSAVSPGQVQQFIAASQRSVDVLGGRIDSGLTDTEPKDAGLTEADPREELASFLRTRTYRPATLVALRQTVDSIGAELSLYHDLRRVPEHRIRNVRNDLYMVSEVIRLLQVTGAGGPSFSPQDLAVLNDYRHQVDAATKFIPVWVKVAVALSLGLGTMIGWKRIVVTVGERIGKEHLTYAQGASAEITAMCTIGAADMFGLPVSTTHVLSSGVAGTMAANRTGLQWNTVRNLLMAWVLTLPVSICLSASLFWLFRHLAR